MLGRAWIIAIVIAAGCGAPGASGLAGHDGGADDAPVDPAIDAGTDTGTTIDGGAGNPDLVAVCGAMPVTLDDWERCYQKRACDWQVNCVPTNAYRNVQECIDQGDAVEGGRLAAERRERKRAVDQRRAAINVAAFTRCLIETSAARCNTAQFNVSCLTRFTGTIADGASCYTAAECASPDAACQASCADACCLGTCQPKFRQGQACTDRHSCEPGLQCHQTCIAGDINTLCTSDRDCDADAWCDVQARLCRADFAPDTTCTNLLQCGGETSCVGLSVSSGAPGRCLRISNAGDPCDGLCYGNLYCDASGICRNLPVLGQTCSPLIPCGGPDTMCSGNLCVRRGDVGATCGAQTCLPGLFCTSELNDASPMCAARRGTGLPCTAPAHCESYLCSGTAGQPGTCLAWSDTCSQAVN
jgi:hypothetical protein